MIEDDYVFEKLYSVYIERSDVSYDGYIFLQVKKAIKGNKKDFFILTYHFKKNKNNRNPLVIIDSIEGKDFFEKVNIINHFKKNHALEYSIEMDGLKDLKTKEKK